MKLFRLQWCHVMEVESFESEAVADVLNAGFVSIKVDREVCGPSRLSSLLHTRVMHASMLGAGASRCGQGVHDVHPGHPERRRVAHERVPDAHTAALLWR